MADQNRHYDLVIIGTGSAASTAAFRCRAAGWRVAVIDARPFGGTCALRGCHPKKMLVSAAEVIDATARMAGKGVRTHSVAIDWQELMRFKRIFTQAIFSYLIVNKRIKCYFRENPSGYKSLTLEKSTA
jgi:glutathione reductase (NADPH)